LFQVQNKKLAKELVEVLNKHFPQSLKATVVRETEVNIYDVLKLDKEYVELMDYILFYREKYLGMKNDEREKAIYRRFKNGVIEFAKTQVPNFQKLQNRSRAYNAYKRREAQKRKVTKKDDYYGIER
tara:strand:+ start:468 stop:848 length:381 start_codon:yes stop_codon:yes gene_type:complete